MEIRKLKGIMASIFVDGFACSAGFGAIIDYVRTSDSIQFMFGLTLIAFGAIMAYTNFEALNEAEAKK